MNNASQPKSFRWPLIVVALLLGHMTLMLVAVVLSRPGKGSAVIPDYYQKSTNWDRTHPATGGAR